MKQCSILIRAYLIHLHKSFYNKVDLEIYDEAKTIPPAGLFTDKGSIPKDITEIDITKAYTSRLIEITQIPVFNQFDVWKNGLKRWIFTRCRTTLYILLKIVAIMEL